MSFLNDRQLERLKNKAIFSMKDSDIQPASIDLKISDEVYEIPYSFLSQERDVLDTLESMELKKEIFSNKVLEKGKIYLFPLMEEIDFGFKESLVGIVSPKSTSGRLGLFCRLVVDRSGCQAKVIDTLLQNKEVDFHDVYEHNNNLEFNRIPPGYKGKIYLEVSPMFFDVLLTPESKLIQLRIFDGRVSKSHKGNFETLDLTANLETLRTSIAGWRTKKDTEHPININMIGKHDKEIYWDPIRRGEDLIIQKDELVIISSLEYVQIPKNYIGEMISFREELGEFRSHYAGFFDPGFGLYKPSRAIMEIQGRDVPFKIEHGQPIAKIRMSKIIEPQKIYGENNNNYSGQEIRLAKQFY